MDRPNALIVRGGWEGHAPVEATELLLPFLRDKGYTVRIEESSDVDAGGLDAVDLIVQCVTMSEIAEPQLKGLLKNRVQKARAAPIPIVSNRSGKAGQ
nr:hypothetical protein [Glycomyces xiaoerkulensis]